MHSHGSPRSELEPANTTSPQPVNLSICQPANVLLLLLLRCGFQRRPLHFRQEILGGQRRVGRRHLDAHIELALGVALEDAAGRRHVGVVAPDGGADVPFAREQVVRRVEADSA
ncbi:MAG: hypothetical protein MI924_29030 [Chloroflexales bacterium]|nr:hypothetical protein [Chloroflexales bacterium]